MPDTRYLKQRAGKGRSGARWYVRVPIPSDLWGRYGRSRTVERSLNTGDLREAQRRRHAAVADIQAEFDRRRLGAMTSADVEREAQEHLTRRLEVYRDRPGDAFREFVDELGSEHGREGEEVLATLLACRGDGDWSAFESEAAEIAGRYGTEPSDELRRAVLDSEIAALSAALTLNSGTVPERPAVINARAVDPVTFAMPRAGRMASRAGQAPRVTEAAERYVADRTRDEGARWTRQTERQYQVSFRLFADFSGDTQLDAVTREGAAEFLETVGRLHKNYGRSVKSAGLGLDELLKRFPGPPGLSNVTLNRHARALHGLYKWAIKVGVFDGDNPFAGQHRPTGKRRKSGWQPFTVDELNALLAHPLLTETSREDRVRPRRHSAQTAMMWVPLIGLFSGMRLDEICGLRTEDVRKEDGIAFFDVVEHEGRAVKSEAGVRRVPVHSALVEADLLDYVAHIRKQEHAFLLPGLRPGGPDGKRNWYFSKRFTEYRRAVGVTRNRVAFHSLRKNVVASLERARVHQSEVAQLVGHERGFTFSVYAPRGLDLSGLKSVVEQICYEGLEPIGIE